MVFYQFRVIGNGFFNRHVRANTLSVNYMVGMVEIGFGKWGFEAENIGGLLVLKGENMKGPTLKVWRPKATKPYIHYYYRSVEQRDAAIQRAVEDFNSHLKTVEERKVSRRGTDEDLEKVNVGDIFHDSWGYEQTNIDFYCIIKRSGDWVTIMPMGKKETTAQGYSMTNDVVPTIINWSAKPIRKKIYKSRETWRHGQELGFRFGNYSGAGWCSLWDGKPARESHYA